MTNTEALTHWVLTAGDNGGVCLKPVRVVSRFRTEAGSKRVTVALDDGSTITTIPEYVTKRS